MATDVYWDPTNGNDANNGLTPATARKLLRSCRQISAVTPGSNIILVDGLHYHTIPGFNNQDDVRFKNGAENNPIVIRAQTPGQAILDASLIPNGSASQFLWFSAVSWWTMKDIVIQNVNWQRAIRVENCSNILLDNMLINGVYTHGLRLSGTNITVQNCVGMNLCKRNENNVLGTGGWDTGFGTTKQGSGVDSSNINFINCQVINSWGEAYGLFNLTNSQITNCSATNGFSVNFYVSGAANLTFANNVVTMNNPAYVRIQDGDNLQRAFGWAAEAETDTSPTNLSYTGNVINGNGYIGNAFNYVNYGSPATWANQYYANIVIDGNEIYDVIDNGLRAQKTASLVNFPANCQFVNNTYRGNFTLTDIALADQPAWTIDNNNPAVDRERSALLRLAARLYLPRG